MSRKEKPVLNINPTIDREQDRRSITLIEIKCITININPTLILILE